MTKPQPLPERLPCLLLEPSSNRRGVIGTRMPPLQPVLARHGTARDCLLPSMLNLKPLHSLCPCKNPRLYRKLEMHRHAIKKLLCFTAGTGATPLLAGRLGGALAAAGYTNALSIAAAGVAGAALPAAAAARLAPWRSFSAEADAGAAQAAATPPGEISAVEEQAQQQEQQQQQRPRDSRRKQYKPLMPQDPALERLHACASAADLRAWRAALEGEGRFGADQLALLMRVLGHNQQGLGDEERTAYLRELLGEAAQGAVALNGKAGEQPAGPARLHGLQSGAAACRKGLHHQLLPGPSIPGCGRTHKPPCPPPPPHARNSCLPAVGPRQAGAERQRPRCAGRGAHSVPAH